MWKKLKNIGIGLGLIGSIILAYIFFRRRTDNDLSIGAERIDNGIGQIRDTEQSVTGKLEEVSDGLVSVSEGLTDSTDIAEESGRTIARLRSILERVQERSIIPDDN